MLASQAGAPQGKAMRPQGKACKPRNLGFPGKLHLRLATKTGMAFAAELGSAGIVWKGCRIVVSGVTFRAIYLPKLRIAIALTMFVCPCGNKVGQ